MYRLALLFCITMLVFSSFSLAVAAPSAAESQLVLLEQRAGKAATSTTGEYAKTLLDAAKASISDAKISVAAGKEKLASRQIELAEIQLNAADAKAAEKELFEKVAVRRSELKKMEAQLERFRQGEEN